MPGPGSVTQLEPTSERLVEDQPSSLEGRVLFLTHLATYRFAAGHVQGMEVLDYGCGSGYGSAVLGDTARSVHGVDVAPDAIAHARSRHARDNVCFDSIRPVEEGPAPFADASFDAVVSFQVIEHVRDVPAYLAEIARLLRPGGLFLLATPDRRSRLLRFQRPWNPWHLREYAAEDLHRALACELRFEPAEVLRLGGQERALRPELRRTRRMRWLALPATLPVLPDSLRRGLLHALGALRARLAPAGGGGGEVPAWLDESCIEIGPDAPHSVILVARVRRRP